ncbi:MAG: glycosyltransferase family 2 protein [Candidatus Rokubacteria bacterium]|nr:glycosyltransferase family 2 protein [Candidatus Rokubacteria bacterium]
MSGGVDVSIVIPYFERPAELTTLLRGLATVDRDGLAVEALVVEDGSAVEDAAGLAQAHPGLGLRFLRNDRNRGPGYSRNRGAAEARGRYLWFVDSDTEVPHPRVLHGLVAALARTPPPLAAGGQLEAVGGVPHVMRPEILPSLHFMLAKVPLRDDYREELATLSTTNFFIARERFLAAGGFDTTLRMNEDSELCLRLRQVARGGVFYQDASTLLLHTVSPRGRDASFFDYFDDRRRYMRVKLRTRNLLLRRYMRWRLLVLPLLEAISIAAFARGMRTGRWHLSRLAVAGGAAAPVAWLHHAVTLAGYNALAIGLFFAPARRAERLPGGRD